MSDIERLGEHIDEYDEQSQELFQQLKLADAQLDEIDRMKRTDGWKLVEKTIRVELVNRIMALVADDAEIKTLLALLTFTDVKAQKKALREQIQSALPDPSG